MECLLEESNFRFTAITLVFIVWAVVESVNPGLVLGEMLLQAQVQRLHVSRRVVAEGDAALVGDDDNPASGMIERGDSAFSPRQDMEIAPAPDVSVFGWLAVDHAVAVEEDAADIVVARRHLDNRFIADVGD